MATSAEATGAQAARHAVTITRWLLGGTLDEVAGLSGDPALELVRRHQDKLTTRHHLDEGLHASLERVHAHAQRSRGFPAGEQQARHALDGPGAVTRLARARLAHGACHSCAVPSLPGRFDERGLAAPRASIGRGILAVARAD